MTITREVGLLDVMNVTNVTELSGRRVVILGLARQGTALARFLAQAGADVVVSDLRKEAALADRVAELDDLPIDFVLGKHPKRLLEGTDLLCLSGGEIGRAHV